MGLSRAKIEELRKASSDPPESGVRVSSDELSVDLADYDEERDDDAEPTRLFHPGREIEEVLSGVTDGSLDEESYEVDEVDDRAVRALRDPLDALLESVDALAALASAPASSKRR